MPASGRRQKLDKTKLEGLRGALSVRVSLKKDSGPNDKSTDDQEGLGRQWAERTKVKIAGIYADVGRSASRFATKPRENFERMLEDIGAGKLDIIWFWSIDRSARNLAVLIALRDLCRERGVLIAVGDQVYDPGQFADMLGPIIMGLVAEGESEAKSEACARGNKSNAEAGLPYPPITYGYRRLYTPGLSGRRMSEALKAQIPDGLLDESDEALSGLGWLAASFVPGSPVTDDMLAIDSPAMIVREIFRRYAAGDSYSTIAKDLNRRRIPTSRKPGTGRASDNPIWREGQIHNILKNPFYAAIRWHVDKMLPDVDAKWPPLVSRDLYWAIDERMAGRKGWRGTGGDHVLNSILPCGRCGVRLLWAQGQKPYRGKNQRPAAYICSGCTRLSVQAAPLEKYVTERVVTFLSTPAVFDSMAQAGTSEEAAKARGEAAELRSKLEEVYELFTNDKISDELASRKEAKLLADIAEKDKKANEAGIPSTLLGGVVGPKAARIWADKTPQQKREIIRTVAEITIKPMGSGNNNQYTRKPISDRIQSWKWLIGPDAEEPTTKVRNVSRHELFKPDPVPGVMTETDDGKIILTGDFTTEEKGEIARKLIAERGWTVLQIADAMGLTHSSVCYWLKKIGAPSLEVLTRERTKAFLPETELNHTAVARKIGTNRSVVDRACLALISDGTMPQCTHHLREDGHRRVRVPDAALTARRQEVVRRRTAGEDVKSIAAALGMNWWTVYEDLKHEAQRCSPTTTSR